MKIYTKKGDTGTTGLFGGNRLDKNDIRIDAYGTVDELNSFLGVVLDSCNIPESAAFLGRIQHWLFAYGSVLATAPGSKLFIDQPGEDAIIELEQAIDAMESELPPLKHFILPSGYLPASHTHVARCVCRRAERLIVGLSQRDEVDPVLLKFFNRLSDYLFVLSRFLMYRNERSEIAWIPEHKK